MKSNPIFELGPNVLEFEKKKFKFGIKCLKTWKMGFKPSFGKFSHFLEGIKIKIGGSFKKEKLGNKKKTLNKVFILNVELWN